MDFEVIAKTLKSFFINSGNISTIYFNSFIEIWSSLLGIVNITPQDYPSHESNTIFSLLDTYLKLGIRSFN
jgi:hypothetical protein